VRTFDLRGVDVTLRLEGDVPDVSAAYVAWDYRAQLQGHSLKAEVTVGDDNPGTFIEFFGSLAQDWRGWSGTRAYESLDSTLSITAAHDGAGEIRFEVRLRAGADSGFDWSAIHRLTVEPGHLGAIAAAAREFAT
jgi:hypothetical protein